MSNFFAVLYTLVLHDVEALTEIYMRKAKEKPEKRSNRHLGMKLSLSAPKAKHTRRSARGLGHGMGAEIGLLTAFAAACVLTFSPYRALGQ